MTILVVYSAEPTFPATDQQPGASRYQIGEWWVDAVGVAPSLADVEAFLAPALPDLQPYQFFSMLDISGHTDALNAYVNGLPAPQNIIARNKLDRSLSFQRDNELVLAAQTALGLSDAQLDALWTQAAAIS